MPGNEFDLSCTSANYNTPQAGNEIMFSGHPVTGIGTIIEEEFIMQMKMVADYWQNFRSSLRLNARIY